MEQLPPEQYETVLKYMQTVNEQSFQSALEACRVHQFSLERALNARFNPVGQRGQRQERQERRPEEDHEIVRRYIEYVQRRNAEWSLVGALFGVVRTLVMGTLGLLSHLVPNSMRVRYFGTQFQRLYLGALPGHFRLSSIPSLLKLTRNVNDKSVLVLVSPGKVHPQVSTFLGDAELQRLVGRDFFFTGHVIGHPQLGVIGEVQAPMLVALRWNMFQELKEVGRMRELGRVDANLLNRWAHEGRNLFKRDCNVLIKYRNYFARLTGNFYEEDEEEESSLAERDLTARERREQNRAYQEVEAKTREAQKEAALRAEAEEEERRKKEEVEFERRVRKSSIPDEPMDGQMVRLSFRCPDGRTLMRNFGVEEKLDLVYHWVELNEEIGWEDEHNRRFEIMHSYPPVGLGGRREELLRDIFEGEQEKLVIREL